MLITILSLSIAISIFLFLLKRLVLEKFRLPNLQERPVFITGCDSGFGHSLTLKLLENGIPTYAGCYTENGQLDLREKTKNLPGKLTTLKIDVTKDETIREAYESVKKDLNRRALWGFVCNAGVAHLNGPDDWLTIDHYQKTLDVNTFGVIRTCHWFKKLVKPAGKGRIVVVTSMIGRIAFPNLGPYTVSKYAAEGYADTLRLECHQFGCSVHILEPGFHNTGITNLDVIYRMYDQIWDQLPEETKQEYGLEFKESMKRVCKSSLLRWAGNELDPVTDAYFHALTARFPRDRYVIGTDAKYLLIPLSYFPACVQVHVYNILQWIEGVPKPACFRKSKKN